MPARERPERSVFCPDIPHRPRSRQGKTERPVDVTAWPGKRCGAPGAYAMAARLVAVERLRVVQRMVFFFDGVLYEK
jgi:hypothetical protein